MVDEYRVHCKEGLDMNTLVGPVYKQSEEATLLSSKSPNILYISSPWVLELHP